jgi:regulator of protease activity HflC (stomatin/prohibitin superfamily)
MTFIDWLLSIWKEIVPVAVVESWERGCRFRRGVPEPTELGPGIWFFVPFFDRIEIIPTKARFIDLPVQSIATADGVEIALSANIGYEITDAVKAYTEVHDYEESLARLAAGHLHRRIHEQTHAELVANLGKLEKSLEGTLTTRAKKWGIVIQDVGVTDLVKARAYRLLQG